MDIIINTTPHATPDDASLPSSVVFIIFASLSSLANGELSGLDRYIPLLNIGDSVSKVPIIAPSDPDFTIMIELS